MYRKCAKNLNLTTVGSDPVTKMLRPQAGPAVVAFHCAKMVEVRHGIKI